MRAIAWLTLAFFSAACSGPPAQIVAGRSDTVLVNSQKSTLLPVHVLDAAGHELNASRLDYKVISGDSIGLSTRGVVRCAKRGDTRLRVSLGNLTTDFVLLCRPVKGFRFMFDPGPPLLVGGPPRELALGAIGMDDMPVMLLAGTATIEDSGIAVLRGLTVEPRAVGGTFVAVDIGDCVHWVYVEVDEVVTSSRDLERRNQVFNVSPLRLVGGEIRSWAVPRGDYMFSLRPEDPMQKDLVLGGVNVNCVSHPDVGQTYHCLAFDHAAVVVRNMRSARPRSALAGDLFVKRMDALAPAPAAPVRSIRRIVPRQKPSCRLVH
jgi:hypothetical protein